MVLNINYKDFDFKLLTITNKDKNYYLKYDKQNFNIIIKNLYSPFNIKDYNNNLRFNITYQVEKDVQTFLDNLKDRIIDLLIENNWCKKLFKTDNKEVIENNFNELYKEPTDEKYLPLSNFKLMNNKEDNNNINIKLFNEEKKLLANKSIEYHKLIDSFGKRTTFSVLVNPYFYNINKRMGVSMQTKHLRIIKKQTELTLDEPLFSDIEEEEEEELQEEIQEEIKTLDIQV